MQSVRNLIEKRFSQDRLYLDGLGRLGRCIFSWTLGLGFASLHDSQQVSVRLFLFLFFFPSHGHNCQSLPLLLPPSILPPLLPHGNSVCKASWLCSECIYCILILNPYQQPWDLPQKSSRPPFSIRLFCSRCFAILWVSHRDPLTPLN